MAPPAVATQGSAVMFDSMKPGTSTPVLDTWHAGYVVALPVLCGRCCAASAVLPVLCCRCCVSGAVWPLLLQFVVVVLLARLAHSENDRAMLRASTQPQSRWRGGKIKS